MCLQRHLIFRLFSCLFLAGLLLSCSGKSSHETTLRLWVMPNTPSPAQDMRRILKGFEMENPGLHVEVTVLSWNDGMAKINMAAASQDGPDLLQVPTTWAADFTARGLLLPLDSLLAALGGDTVFVPSSRPYMQPIGAEHPTSLPWFVEVRPLYYRTDVLRQLKINPAKLDDWTDWTEALAKIQKMKPNIGGVTVAPFGYPAKGDWNVIHNFVPWIWGAGGSFLDSTATHSNIANPKTIEGITFYLNLTRNGYNNKSNLDKNTSQISADFDNGEFAFITETVNKTIYLDGPQNLMRGDASTVGRNYACIPLPSSPAPGQATYFVGGSNLGVFHSTKHSREAQALLRYLTARSSAQYQFSRTSGFLPALNETYNSRYFTENANRRVFRAMVQKGRGYPAVPYWAGIETGILAKGFDNIFTLIAESKSGTWPEQEILDEILKMDAETERFIQSELKKR